MRQTPAETRSGSGGAIHQSGELPDFDPLADTYRWLEIATFGPKLMRCRQAFLDEMRSCRSALVIGDGDGRFTAQLLRENRAVSIDAVDGSREMLRALIKNAGGNGRRVHIHLADARRWEPADQPYDLIVTHFFLDCLTTAEIAKLARRLRPRVAPHARWVVSEFAIPRSWVGRLIARPLVASLYLAFRVLTGLNVRRLPDHHAALAEAGFYLAREQRFLAGLLVSEMWQPGLPPDRSPEAGSGAVVGESLQPRVPSKT